MRTASPPALFPRALLPLALLALLALLVVAPWLAGCTQLPGVLGPQAVPQPAPPRVTVAGVTLVAFPAAQTVARALCPQVAPGPVCLMLGGAPSPAELRFVFDVALDVENANNFPFPMVEALAAFTAFPDAPERAGDAGGAQNLGAVCMSMCDDPGRCPQNAADACSGGGANIRTREDFARAAAGFLLATATGQESLDNLRVKTVPAAGRARVVFRLELEPMVMVSLLARLAGDALAQVRRGNVPRFAVPYAIEGSVWVRVENFGKIGAGFGPVRGTWELR
jgi:hypothetical protein